MKCKHKFTATLGLPIVEFSEDYLGGYTKAIFDVMRIVDKHANKYAGDIGVSLAMLALYNDIGTVFFKENSKVYGRE